MSMTVYIIIGVVIVILFLLVRLFKFINGPKMEKEKTKRKMAWYDFRRYIRDNRRWNRKK